MKQNIEEMVEKKLFLNQKETTLPVIWTYRINGILNLGHVVPLLNIVKLLNDSVNVKILLDDSEDNKKVQEIKSLIVSFVVNLNSKAGNLSFITTSQIRDNEEFVMDFFKLISVTTESQAMKTISTTENIKMYDLIKPVLFINDIQFIENTSVLMGENKKTISELSKTILKEINKKELSFELHPMVYDCKNDVMSKTNKLTRIDVIETSKSVEKKVRKYFCDEENVDTALFGIFENVIFPFLSFSDANLVIYDLEKCKSEYKDIKTLKDSFKQKKIHPGDLKDACSRYINEIFDCFCERSADNLKRIKSIFN
ncbi:putative tyrosine--tRNA ligase, cytoplasmic [Nosema granulosis]|uniref:tyrosine--tRNA ligase n=1 Tax=Nosema granulosis TaxID=83296 RepID=A0A9P6H0B8_9MICR|nr:putative tyrosine--tRNA ligase, cytoplasmic [Nosema granulosis]